MRWAAVLLISTVVWAGDRDGDGLSDFEEMHKYRTDPDKKDSDGDGKPDGDWDERREYAYTVRSIVRVMRPAQAISGDQQDARVRAETKEYVELEVIHYPLNTAAKALRGNPDWRRDKSQRKLLASTTTSNHDAKLRRQLLAELDGIDLEDCDDRALVTAAAARLLKRANYHKGFTTFFVHFPRGKPAIYPGLEKAVAANRLADTPLKEQWQRELFAKGMFATKSHSSCTSSSIYLAGGLRAVGIPTRIVYCVPVIDASDPDEWRMLARLKHHRLRNTIRAALTRARHSWSSHTFNEVYVGGRWWWLNYTKLAQGNLDKNYFGLMTHVLTVRDWADAKMAQTVGTRQGTPKKRDAFAHANPYSTVELSDRFGVHAKIPNPEVAEFRKLSIERAIWYGDRPKGVSLKLRDPKSAGHVLLKVKENRDGSQQQYASFWDFADRKFVLRAKGAPEIAAHVTRGYWGPGWFYLRIEPGEYRKMQPRVAYALVPRNKTKAYRWSPNGVKLTR